MAGTRNVDTVFSHTVAAPNGGVSLLDYLSRRFPYHPRSGWEERIRNGSLRVDDLGVQPDWVLRSGMRVEYRVEGYAEPEVPIDFRPIAESGDLALVHKPAGLPVHKTHRIFVHTLANLYRQARNDVSWTPLHRLDMETSGLVAFARGKEAFNRYSPQAPESRWTKIYLAVARGEPPESGILAMPLREQPGDPLRSRMHALPSGKTAETLFRVLLRGQDLALVLAKPITGRKHQIRAHLAAAGFPLLGDKTYFAEGRYYLKRLETPLTAEDFAELGAPHHLLHAYYLEIRGEGGEGICGFDADLPKPFLAKFPDLSDLLPILPQSKAFRDLIGDGF